MCRYENGRTGTKRERKGDRSIKETPQEYNKEECQKREWGQTMTKKNVWQALALMSAFFFINQLFFQGESVGNAAFMTDKIESMCLSLTEGMFRGMLPTLYYKNKEERLESFLEGMGRQLTEEIFPAVDYCEKYWKNTESFLAKKDEIPEYFLEAADEKKEEVAHDVAAEKPAEGAKTYTKEQLADYSFLIKNFYVVDSTTSVTSGELKGEELAYKDLSISLEGEEPKILLYHTHGSEAFADSKSGKKKETIIGVGDTLAKILEEEYGIKVYHDRNFYDTINGRLDRSKAYTYAGNAAAKILEKYPSIQVVIDLHRDAVTEGKKLVTNIDGTKMAQIMFFNGLSRTAMNGDISYLKNPNKEDNLAFSLQMQLKAAELYPGLTRKIYLKGYRYNLHLKPRSLLIEAGAQTNTKKEVKNAMKPLARLLYEVLKRHNL